MKCLMLKEPWLWLVEMKIKTLETRTWRTNYRGPLTLGASRQIDKAGYAYLASRSIRLPTIAALEERLGKVHVQAHLSLIEPYLETHVPQGLCVFTPGEKRFGWFLEDVKSIERPFPIKGKLGLFEVPWPPRGALTDAMSHGTLAP